MMSSKWTLLRVIVCGAMVGLAGCQYIKPIAVVLSLLTSRQERVVHVEVAVPQVDREPAETDKPPATGK